MTNFYTDPEPPSLHLNAAHQVNRWKHAADWWGGRIVPWVIDRAKEEHAVEMVRTWTEKYHIPQ